MSEKQELAEQLFVNGGKIMIDAAIFEALAVATTSSAQELDASAGTEQEHICWVRMNFIKHFTEDVFFLNNHAEDEAFLRRYGNLIIRNMLEQLIEFLYLMKNPHRAEEFLGLTIELEELNKKTPLIQRLKLLGEKRYNKEPVKYRRHGKEQNIRPSVAEMAEEIGEKYSTTGGITLYDLYQILSDQCHNAYFSSLTDDVNKVHHSIPAGGLNENQMKDVHIMALIVLDEFKSTLQG